ncbi:MAG TPA: LacI family DNA-binding transcriptional regulator [Gammaproteobacteria bacterium]|nr:LacI family DNA-binding transcriptional regulator [Gammaproteobacteria bacterium]
MNSPRPARRRVRLTDIAAACRVSAATVSLALRDSPLVNAKTRERIAAELKRQGYVYHRGAANLRQQTSSAVALVINDLSNPFFAEFAAGVDEALAAAGYVTLLGSSAESPQRQTQVLSSLLEHDPAGFILSPAENSDPLVLQQLLGEQAPVLVFNRELKDSPWDFLVCDNRHGARLATEHLIRLGHKRIAFFGGHAHSSSCQQRRAGYEDAVRAAGLPVATQMLECAPTRLEAAAATPSLFADGARPTAAVCYNDAVALGLMHGLNSQGLRAGWDFAVTGFDDIAEAETTTPALTTVAVDPRGLGQRAARLLLKRLGEPERPAQRTVAAVLLKLRASTCPPPEPKT